MDEYQVLWTQGAEFDIVEIIEYIKLDSISQAGEIFKQISKIAETLETMPFKGRIVPELQSIGIEKYRELLFKRWRILYKVEENRVYILMIVDANRDVEDLLFRRLIRVGKER